MDLLNLRIALLLQREKERERETSLNWNSDLNRSQSIIILSRDWRRKSDVFSLFKGINKSS